MRLNNSKRRRKRSRSNLRIQFWQLEVKETNRFQINCNKNMLRINKKFRRRQSQNSKTEDKKERRNDSLLVV